MITNAEFAILGLVSEAPKYGYQIEQDIEKRGMRNWTDIGFSSIYYVLNKLEKAGLLCSEMMIEGYRPARKIYHLTENGKTCFVEELRERLSQPRPRTDDFDLALSNMAALTPEDVRTAVREYQQLLNDRLRLLREKWDGQKDVVPRHVGYLFNHNRAMLQAELDWVNQMLRKLEESGQMN